MGSCRQQELAPHREMQKEKLWWSKKWKGRDLRRVQRATTSRGIRGWVTYVADTRCLARQKNVREAGRGEGCVRREVNGKSKKEGRMRFDN